MQSQGARHVTPKAPVRFWIPLAFCKDSAKIPDFKNSVFGYKYAITWPPNDLWEIYGNNQIYRTFSEISDSKFLPKFQILFGIPNDVLIPVGYAIPHKTKFKTYIIILTTLLSYANDWNLLCNILLYMDLATVRGGASNSLKLITLPLNKLGFVLHKSAFQDALSTLCMPTLCAFKVFFLEEHVLSCPNGELPSLRHNEIRDLTVICSLTAVCSDCQSWLLMFRRECNEGI